MCRETGFHSGQVGGKRSAGVWCRCLAFLPPKLPARPQSSGLAGLCLANVFGRLCAGANISTRLTGRPSAAPIAHNLVVCGLGRRVRGRGGRSVRAGVFGTAALSACLVMSAVSVGSAQSPPSSAAPAPPSSAPPSSATPPSAAAPLPGFVPPYEITKIVRAAGYDPLTRPRREGTTYVVRATNYRGILMRIVVDARTGAIRAVNRIVPGPGPYGVLGMTPPPPYGGAYDPPIGPLAGPPPPYPAAGPYGPSPGPPPPYPVTGPYGPPPPYPPPYYDAPPGYGMAPDMIEPMEAGLYPPPPPSYAPAPPLAHSHPSAPSGQSLPRSRPPELATHETKPPHNDKPAETPAIKSAPPPGAAATAPLPPPVEPTVPAATPEPPTPPSPPPAAAAPTTPVAPAKKPPLIPPIQD
jgi:hypothetical protein